MNRYLSSLNILKNDVKLYIQKHSQKSRLYSYIYNTIMYTSIFIGIFIGFSLTSLGFDKNIIYFQIPVAILSFINSLFIAIIKFKNFEEISITHTKATKEYLSLYKAIVNQILNEGEDYKLFTSWAFQKFDTIYQSSPFIIDKRMYENNLSNEDVAKVNSNEDGSITISIGEEHNNGSTQMIEYELRRLRSNNNNNM